MNPLQRHWPEYAIEAICLALFMMSACLFTILLEHPALPFHQMVPNAGMRRALMGLAMGGTAVVLIYSPLGRRSGAHMNPSVTLSFWRLGRIRSEDAVFYVLAQFIGGAVGVLLVSYFLWPFVSDPAVRFAMTRPGEFGPAAAWIAEFFISFLLMSTVLISGSNPAWMGRTGLLAGSLVALYITFEAPISGMSMNPARSFGSAFPPRLWEFLWIYFTAPPLGMLASAELFRIANARPMCAKLVHDMRYRCIFCGHQPRSVS